MPGDGDLRIDGFIRAALDAGYTGAFELEMVGPDDRGRGSCAGTAARAVERTNKLLEEVLP